MADTVLFSDNIYGSIASGLTTTDTTIALTSGHGARFPTVASGQVLYATLLNSANLLEQIHITTHSASSDNLAVTRAANGTTAKSWTAGDRIECRVTSEHLVALRDFTTGTHSYTKAQRGTPVVLTSTASSVAINLDDANNFTLAMTQNTTLAAPTGTAVAGQSGAIVITQHATTAYTLALTTSFWKSPSGVQPTLSTGLSAVDVLNYYTESASRATVVMHNDTK